MKFKLNTLYNLDCMEAMKEIPDKYFDLAIVDYNAAKERLDRHRAQIDIFLELQKEEMWK